MLETLLEPGDCVLVKGSRRTGLDRFVTAYAARETVQPALATREDAA